MRSVLIPAGSTLAVRCIAGVAGVYLEVAGEDVARAGDAGRSVDTSPDRRSLPGLLKHLLRHVFAGVIAGPRSEAMTKRCE